MEKTILIDSITEKTGKSGKKYYEVKTDAGMATCFEEIYADLLRCWKKDLRCVVEWAVEGKYTNIKAFIKEDTANTPVSAQSFIDGVDTTPVKTECIEQVVINKTFRANSYEWGKAGDRLKVYFDDATDLDQQISDLREKGYGVVQPAVPEEEE